jgi:hypothetical protein
MCYAFGAAARKQTSVVVVVLTSYQKDATNARLIVKKDKRSGKMTITVGAGIGTATGIVTNGVCGPHGVAQSSAANQLETAANHAAIATVIKRLAASIATHPISS